MELTAAFGDLVALRDWGHWGLQAVGATFVLVAGYAAVRLARCRSVLQGVGELTRASSAALCLTLFASVIGLFPWWHDLLNHLEEPWTLVGMCAMATLMIVVPARLVAVGTRLSWQGYWACRLITPPRLAEEDSLQGHVADGIAGQSRLTGELLRLAGWACLLGGAFAALWGYAGILEITTGSTSFFQPLTAVWVIVGAARFGSPLLTRARRHLARVVPSTADLPAGSYVLYLRPFNIDDGRAWSDSVLVPPHPAVGALTDALMTGLSDEPQIAAAVRPVGPMIGVGIPDELPYPGAVRMYLPETGWQSAVARLIPRARLVVVTLASSAATMWELAESMRSLPPQRLLLMVPCIGRGEYEAIRARNRAALRKATPPRCNPTWKGHDVPVLPEYQESMSGQYRKPYATSGIIYFSANWRPTFTEIRPYNKQTALIGITLFSVLRKGMVPALEQLSEHERRTGRYYG